MGKLIDLTGQRFGRLIVLAKSNSKQGGKTWWTCRCDCGKILDVWSVYLRNGTTKSCGCLSRELSSYRFRAIRKAQGADGRSATRLYSIWRGMIQRCENPNAHYYDHYGGRGIQVCKEWRNSFSAFRQWALKNGYGEGLTIDRIDNDGNYSPENCRWADSFIQCNNMRSNRMITYAGKTLSVSQWAVELGISRSTLAVRLCKGWSIQRALATPSEHKYASKLKKTKDK